jgi:hypothetical protein
MPLFESVLIPVKIIVDFSFRLPCALKIEKDLKSSAYDGIVVIVTSDLEASNHAELLKGHFTSAAKVNTALYLPTNVISSSSLVHLINF